jgi:hypothetical protein
MGTQAPTSIANWKFFQNHVQSELQGGQFVSAATILIAAGPPRLRDAAGAVAADGGANKSEIAFPIGVIENFGMSQNRQLQRMFEIGSKRSYFVPGRTIGSVSLGRVLFFGPSLLRVLYAYYPTSLLKFKGGPDVAHPLNSRLAEKDLKTRTPVVQDRPGFGRPVADPSLNADFWINLASDLFDHPFGLLCFLRDAQNDAYGAFYLEDTNIQAHQLNVNASSVLVAEGTSAQYDKVVPINIGSLPLTD